MSGPTVDEGRRGAQFHEGEQRGVTLRRLRKGPRLACVQHGDQKGPGNETMSSGSLRDRADAPTH